MIDKIQIEGEHDPNSFASSGEEKSHKSMTVVSIGQHFKRDQPDKNRVCTSLRELQSLYT